MFGRRSIEKNDYKMSSFLYPSNVGKNITLECERKIKVSDICNEDWEPACSLDLHSALEYEGVGVGNLDRKRLVNGVVMFYGLGSTRIGMIV